MMARNSLMRKIVAAIVIAAVTHAVNNWVNSDE